MRMVKFKGANGSDVYINKDSVICAEGVDQEYRDFLNDKHTDGYIPNDLSKANSLVVAGSGIVYLASTLEETLLALGVNP